MLMRPSAILMCARIAATLSTLRLTTRIPGDWLDPARPGGLRSGRDGWGHDMRYMPGTRGGAVMVLFSIRSGLAGQTCVRVSGGRARYGRLAGLRNEHML